MCINEPALSELCLLRLSPEVTNTTDVSLGGVVDLLIEWLPALEVIWLGRCCRRPLVPKRELREGRGEENGILSETLFSGRMVPGNRWSR